MTALSSDLDRVHRRLQSDFPYFARHALKIKTKEGDILPFRLNSAQEYLHKCLEKQKRETGKVRAIIVKGRQQGCSTYISGRYYHYATRNTGQSVFILSHESETTKKLFKMVERFYEKTPPPVRPEAKIANRRELHFASIESEYSVGTAGNENVGRGGTVQLFHGSEVAFWSKTDDIQTGIMQSIPDSDNSEMILESTANGMGNMFYSMTMDAIEGKNDYIVVFIPWYWQSEYRVKTPPANPKLTDEEREYKKLYKLDDYQIWWRRSKIAQFKSEWKFKQEYPAYLLEAFQTSGAPLIDQQRVVQARQSKVEDPNAPLIIGVDPARMGDRTCIVYRRGRTIWKIEVLNFNEEDTIQMQIAGTLINRIQIYKPDKMFIDVGEGWGIIDRMKELGFGDIVTPVHFGSKAIDDDIYINKRAEMWCVMRDWFHGDEGEVSIPDSNEFQRDIAAVPEAKTTSSGKIQLVSKDLIKQQAGFSPDIGDAAALTFAFPVRRGHTSVGSNRIRAAKKGRHTLKTMRRMQQPANTGEVRNIWYPKDK